MVSDDEKIKALSEEQSEKLLGKETFRKRVKEIIDEHTDDVHFMEKVRKYAGMEIDSRIFTSGKYWATLILTAIVTSGIGVLVGVFVPK